MTNEEVKKAYRNDTLVKIEGEYQKWFVASYYIQMDVSQSNTEMYVNLVEYTQSDNPQVRYNEQPNVLSIVI